MGGRKEWGEARSEGGLSSEEYAATNHQGPLGTRLQLSAVLYYDCICTLARVRPAEPRKGRPLVCWALVNDTPLTGLDCPMSAASPDNWPLE